MRIQDGHIVAVGPGRLEPIPDVTLLDGHGRLIGPGLINAHIHSQSATLPDFGHRLSPPALMWLIQARTGRRTPGQTRLAVLLTTWAALTTGTAALFDHFPGRRFTAADLEAVLAAWEETGLRDMVGLRFIDAAFADIAPPLGLDAGATLLHPEPLDEFDELAPRRCAFGTVEAGALACSPPP